MMSSKPQLCKLRAIGHSENKSLTPLSTFEDEVRPAIVAAMTFPKEFCSLNCKLRRPLDGS